MEIICWQTDCLSHSPLDTAFAHREHRHTLPSTLQILEYKIKETAGEETEQTPQNHFAIVCELPECLLSGDL